MSVFLKRTDAFPGWKRKRRGLGVGGRTGERGWEGKMGVGWRLWLGYKRNR